MGSHLKTLTALVTLTVLFTGCAGQDDERGSGDPGGANTGGEMGSDPASGGATAGDGGSTATGGQTNGAGGGSGGETAGVGGAGEPDDCTPLPGGGFVLEDNVVFDERTCLSWTAEQASVPANGLSGFDAAVAHCTNMERGGHADWRLPTAGEAASLITNCPGQPPVEPGFFETTGDMWTSTAAEGDDKVCGAGLASKLFYVWGKSGSQPIRCVRGSEAWVPERLCGSGGSICN